MCIPDLIANNIKLAMNLYILIRPDFPKYFCIQLTKTYLLMEGKVVVVFFFIGPKT